MAKTQSQVDEINRTLHEWMGNCVHEWFKSDKFHYIDFDWECKHCGHSNYRNEANDIPSLFTDLNLLREVEDKLSFKQSDLYGHKIWEHFTGISSFDGLSSNHITTLYLNTPANIRATALCEVIKNIQSNGTEG